MDDWNDFGAPPSDPDSQHHLYAEGESSSQDSSFFGSAGGGGGASRSGDEPRSVMFQVAPARRSSSIAPISTVRTESNAAPSDNPRGLDDDPDFEEIGVSSRLAPFSESDRYHGKSYTKLEVISAMQIQQLVHLFHIVVAIAACWTLFAVIICNTMFLDVKLVKLRPNMLSAAQVEESRQLRLAAKARMSVSAPLSVPTFAGFNSHVSSRARAISPQQTPDPVWSRRCHLYCEDKTDIIMNEFTTADGTLDCCAESHVCFSVMEKSCGPVVRQVDVVQQAAVVRQRIGIDGNAFEQLPFRHEKLEGWYRAMVHIIFFSSGAVLFFLGSLFLIRIVKAGRNNLAQEQVFAVLLIFFTFLFMNMPLSLIQLLSALGFKRKNTPFPVWFNDLENSLTLLRNSIYGPFLFFYVWANIHTYRILDPGKTLGIWFYIPKLALLIPLVLVKTAANFSFSVVMSEVPFIPGVITQHTFGKFNMWKAYPKHMAYIFSVSLVEVLLLGIIVWETFKTLKVLRKAPYMKHRSKQIGFRFFMYISLVYFSVMFALQVLLVVGRPIGNNISLLTLSLVGIFQARVPLSHTTGTVLLTLGYVIISAYVNLPFNSIGAVKGWFKASDLAPPSSRWSASSSEGSLSISDSGSGSGGISGSLVTSTDRRPRDQQPRFIVDKDYELNQEIAEPITYRKRESDDSLELRANCFTMQTHVIMFNFAWYVYYYGTPKFDTLKPEETVLPFRFQVAESISEPATDTHALVIDGVDRIVVTFKGTTSMRNLQTSMKIYHERLINVVPTALDGVDELERLRIIFGRYYEAAKIHKGFAIAYDSVSRRVMRRIKALIDERPRPVFLTGHSLGGALATICSLDVWIKLRISRRQIFVSTFGSPRVGNEAFRRIYNSVIALHWRIVVDPDMVAKIPKVGYRHVGKKVLLTPHGEMFIDPNALELKLWSGNTAGFAYHRKASYLLAMRAWCVRHHKMTYTPAFWPFPVREEDYQRFEGANVEEDRGQLPGHQVARKIIRLDAMVESLDDGTYANMAAIERWARLTRRVLLNHKLNGAMTQ